MIYGIADVDSAYGRYLGTLRQYLLGAGWYESRPEGRCITTGECWSHDNLLHGCVEVTIEKALHHMRFHEEMFLSMGEEDKDGK